MKDFNDMNKQELRAACKDAGVKNYSKMTVQEMKGRLHEVVNPGVEVKAEDPIIGEFVNCPHCGVHLSNGVSYDDGHGFDVNGKREHHNEFQFMCLGCGEEFGPKLPEILPEGEKGTGIKIEKDRPEKHGVKRPSAGGVCRAVWDFCDEVLRNTGGMVPSPSLVKEQAAKSGWNENNAVIELYQWRKFHGIRGRVTKLDGK